MSTTLPAPCDGAPISRDGHAGASHPGWTLTATILASSLAFIDGSVVNVALSSIGRSIGAGPADLQWTVNAYLLPLSALLLLGGAAGDHFGQRRLLLLGITLFLLASVGCALAPSAALLLPSRSLQGVGAAMLMPNSLAMLGHAFSGPARGRAIGTWAAVGAIASAAGPPLGGWLISAVGWRAIFLLNLPVGLAAMLIALRFIEEHAEGNQPLDWAGAALATIALGGLTWSLTLWSSGHQMTPSGWFGVAGGVVAAAAFLMIESARGEAAMMPLSLFASRPFVGLTVLTLFLYGALGGLLVLLPYLLTTIGGYSPLQAGLALLPFPLVIGIASRWIGRLSERLGPRLPLTIGPLVTGVGFAWLHGIDLTAGYWRGVLPGMLIIAIGMAGAVAPLTTAVLSSVDDHHMATASGFNSAVARTGSLVATALSGAVIAETGSALITAFQAAAWVGAGLAITSGLAAFASLEKQVQRPG
jgi:EmrB/QacA subfamily drug resistance transporter